MKVCLLDKSDSWSASWKMDAFEQSVIEDLELEPVLHAASEKDDLIRHVLLRGFFHPIMDADALLYRQKTVQTAIGTENLSSQFYQIAQSTLHNVRHRDWSMGKESASYFLSNKAATINLYLQGIIQICKLEERITLDSAPAFCHFFDRMHEYFGGDGLSGMQTLIRTMLNHHGFSFSGRLGSDLGTEVGERELDFSNKTWAKISARFHLNASRMTFEIPPRDDGAAEALGRYENRISYESARTLLVIDATLRDFFAELEAQAAWLTGVVRLHQMFNRTDCAFPVFSDGIRATDLKNAVLLLDPDYHVIGNTVDLEEKHLLILTGANQGGKTTFLRSLGQAQLMAQSGMFVLAKEFRTRPFRQLFTHFKREEDDHVASGRLDEELKRMNEMVDKMPSHSLILMNESFASTNEHEGSVIHYQITKGLIDAGVSVIGVTHQYEYTQLVQEHLPNEAVFMRAQRTADGKRPFRLEYGLPRRTSYGLDLFNRAFGEQQKPETFAEDEEDKQNEI
ncbi:hypothetical protein OYT88_19535 [Sporolactobacillus sp. CQH2019]|uniref:MutS-related protein n=1 Tax=Sporolactobacillus sp. CQH2019 TaxID=3023512 RepID=UPI002367A425|nr:hypothetical protein [Sporolactobacillus sp. CQH2019]MDD9150724.1 hypothetical protein [Sporolactobacillus sp. CQH2019]